MAIFKRISAASFGVVLFSISVCAQTTNISGIVNTYHKVIDIIPSKACVRVADITNLNVNSRVMLVQMKGASINTSNSSAFGDTTSLNEAGNYEIGAVCYIIGDSVFLFHTLLNTYNYSTGKVQLVQFAEYYSANVVDTVKAASWDSVASTGGVIAIFATEDITLNAPIYADSSGNAGGAYLDYSGSCPVGTGWFYDASAMGSAEGAYKGESVANISSVQDGAKGAPANGGGGGNNHNNSGGGGANLTAGGQGGGNSSSGPFGCNTGNNWGRGGKALSSWGGTKIFMGGGGAAGHSNNGAASFNYGGNGGGIIFIWANNLIGNNDSISANGGNGGASQSDGAGGGGGGGTIIMHVTSYTGNVAINVRGGNGGLSDDGLNIARCFGGGGGGSGGAVYFTGATPSVTVTIAGGAAGAEINRDNGGCNAAVPAAAGNTGQIIPNYTFPRSTDPAGYCLLLLPTTLHYFQVQLINRMVELKWELDQPELVNSFTIEKKTENSDWITLASINASDNHSSYSSEDPLPSPGNNFYRLKITEKNNSFYFSETRKIWVDLFKSDFTIYPNPAIDKVFVIGKFETGKMFRIIDIAGKIIWKQQLQNNLSQIELPRLPSGLYLLEYNGKTKKLVTR